VVEKTHGELKSVQPEPDAGTLCGHIHLGSTTMSVRIYTRKASRVMIVVLCSSDSHCMLLYLGLVT
jgi:putative component of toxin-antitoxin plasmid stabilization module